MTAAPQLLHERRGSQNLWFTQVSKGNRSKSNLTELNATDALDTGFMSHNDWVAHGVRYGFISKTISKIKPNNVLDVGCGRFPLLNYIWKNRSVDAFDYTGLDLRANRKWFDHLKWKKGNVSLVQADIVLDKIQLGLYQLVVCTEVFEHVPTDKAELFVKRLYDWTAPDGTVIFSTPNAGVSDSTAENHKDADGKSREWKYKDKLALMKKVGFKVQDTFGTFIAKRRIPAEFWNENTDKISQFLPHAMFTVFCAAGYPAESNNALFVMTK